MMNGVRLRLATPGDIPFLIATERQPGYDVLVGRFAEDVHRANLADDNWMYFIGLDGSGAPRGMAILQDVKKDPANHFLRRIVVADAGNGFGRPFLTALIDWVFTETEAQRFYLHVRNVNTRARHVYTSLGFVSEGPESDEEPDSTTMALLKSRWR
jgi:RimJ/RimL family protein N-acetyltransferase